MLRYALKLLGVQHPLLRLTLHRRQRIYVRDFAVFNDGDRSCEADHNAMLRIARDKFRFKAASMNFMRRVSRKNGLGPHVCIPPNLK